MEPSFKLSPSEVAQFKERGFLVREALFDAHELAEMRAAFDRLKEKAKSVSSPSVVDGAWFVVEGERIDRIVWCGAAEHCLLDFGSDPRLTVPSAQLLGSQKMEQLICQAHFKLPEDGVSFHWHQDSEHRRYGTPEWTDVNGEGSFVQTILAIDEATLDNGPLLIVPGSHLEGHLGLDKKKAELATTQWNGAVAMTMKPGSVLFLSPFTIHGSQPNQSGSSRRVFINGYAYPGANRRVYPGVGSGRMLSAEQF